jgi:hypothetical protein
VVEIQVTLNATEDYNGTSWTTNSASLTTARYDFAAAGIQTAALGFGGYTGGPTVTAATEEYNDYGEPNTFENLGQVWYNGTTKALKFTDETFSSAWATGGNMNTARHSIAGAGTQTAGLAFGGEAPPYTGATEEYDGTSWATSPGSLNTARGNLAGAGTQTAGLAFGGLVSTPGAKGATEEYNGATWANNPTGLTTARYNLAGAGRSNSRFSFWWLLLQLNTGATEEYNGSTWTAGGTLNTVRNTLAGCGTQTAAFSFWWYYWN